MCCSSWGHEESDTTGRLNCIYKIEDFPGGSDSNESAGNVKELDLIPRLGRSPREGNGYPIQYFCLENSMERGTWQATVHGITKSQTQLSN